MNQSLSMLFPLAFWKLGYLRPVRCGFGGACDSVWQILSWQHWNQFPTMQLQICSYFRSHSFIKYTIDDIHYLVRHYVLHGLHQTLDELMGPIQYTFPPNLLAKDVCKPWIVRSQSETSETSLLYSVHLYLCTVVSERIPQIGVTGEVTFTYDQMDNKPQPENNLCIIVPYIMPQMCAPRPPHVILSVGHKAGTEKCC